MNIPGLCRIISSHAFSPSTSKSTAPDREKRKHDVRRREKKERIFATGLVVMI
jgi:hypothetical protein